MHSFVDVILWNLILLTSPLCVARENHNPTPVMRSVAYVAEDHAYLLIRMDLSAVGRHLLQHLELLTSAHGPARLVDTRSAKKKNLKTCCILSVLTKKTAARDVDVTSLAVGFFFFTMSFHTSPSPITAFFICSTSTSILCPPFSTSSVTKLELQCSPRGSSHTPT